MRRTVSVIAVATVLTFVASVALARFAQPFEGTKWKVKVTPDEAAKMAGEKEFDDTLIFKGGKFTATACEKYGFKPVEYKEEMAPGGMTASFTAEPTSDKEGTAKWHGNKNANVLDGEMTWTKKDGTVLNYTFKGERTEK
jgi:hypothetical protein